MKPHRTNSAGSVLHPRWPRDVFATVIATTQDHNDLCEVCSHGGDLLCCDTCSLVFHTKCLRPELKEVPKGDWSCQFCLADNPNRSNGELLLFVLRDPTTMYCSSYRRGLTTIIVDP